MFETLANTLATIGLIGLGIIIGGAGMFIYLAVTGKLKWK